jgi:hypothetical protein
MIPGHGAPRPIWDSVVGLWNRIDEEEGVRDLGTTCEWLMLAGAEHLIDLRNKRTALADYLAAVFGPNSEVAVILDADEDPVLLIAGKEHDGTLAEVELIDGSTFGRTAAILRPRSDAYPALVLGEIEEEDIPCRVSARIAALAAFPLLEGPAAGFPARISPTGGWDE